MFSSICIMNPFLFTADRAAAVVLLPGGAGPPLLVQFPAHYPRAAGQGQEDVRDAAEVSGHEGECLPVQSYFADIPMSSVVFCGGWDSHISTRKSRLSYTYMSVNPLCREKKER